jgi:hypothetical protein
MDGHDATSPHSSLLKIRKSMATRVAHLAGFSPFVAPGGTGGGGGGVIYFLPAVPVRGCGGGAGAKWASEAPPWVAK